MNLSTHVTLAIYDASFESHTGIGMEFISFAAPWVNIISWLQIDHVHTFEFSRYVQKVKYMSSFLAAPISIEAIVLELSSDSWEAWTIKGQRLDIFISLQTLLRGWHHIWCNATSLWHLTSDFELIRWWWWEDVIWGNGRIDEGWMCRLNPSYIHNIIILMMKRQMRHRHLAVLGVLCMSHFPLRMALSQSNTFDLNRNTLWQLVYGNTTCHKVISILLSSHDCYMDPYPHYSSSNTHIDIFSLLWKGTSTHF